MKKHIVASLALVASGCIGQVDPSSQKHSPTTNNNNPIITAGTDDMGPPSTPTPPAGDMANGDALICGGMQFALQRVAPNVMLVLDRSGSMKDPIATGSTTTKYDDLTAAIDNLATTYGAEMQLGDTFFASDNDCAAGTVGKIAANNATTITTDVKNHSPGGNTPTAATMQAVIDSKELTDATRANYVILATDGQPNCSDTDVTSRIDTLFNATVSVKTFVIGIGAATNTNPTLLNTWADHGHTARSGATHYYQTNSPADLKAAFDSIVGSVASCDFKMMQNAPDPSLINVTLDGAAVPQDPANGYTFDGTTNTVSLHGNACSKLQGNASTQVGVVYGCPPPANPPPIS